MNDIPNPFQPITDKLESIASQIEEVNKRLDLLSRSSKGSEDEYKTIDEIAKMFQVKRETIRKALVPHMDEIEVLQNGSRGKKLVNFTQYRKVFGNRLQ